MPRQCLPPKKYYFSKMRLLLELSTKLPINKQQFLKFKKIYIDTKPQSTKQLEPWNTSRWLLNLTKKKCLCILLHAIEVKLLTNSNKYEK